MQCCHGDIVPNAFHACSKQFIQCSGNIHVCDKIHICLSDQISEAFNICHYSGYCIPKMQEHHWKLWPFMQEDGTAKGFSFSVRSVQMPWKSPWQYHGRCVVLDINMWLLEAGRNGQLWSIWILSLLEYYRGYKECVGRVWIWRMKSFREGLICCVTAVHETLSGKPRVLALCQALSSRCVTSGFPFTYHHLFPPGNDYPQYILPLPYTRIPSFHWNENGDPIFMLLCL